MMMSRPAVYLAGGFRTKWRDRVRRLEGFIFLDPSQHHLREPRNYTAWDLDAIRRADVVLAYLEKENPGGYALALEVGYAKALNKRVLFVEDPGDTRHHYLSMIRAV